MRILIIGVKGFLGGYLADLTVRLGWNVHGLDVSNDSATTDPKPASMWVGDLSALKTMSLAQELRTCDAIVHLAAPGRSAEFEKALRNATDDFRRFLDDVGELDFGGHLMFVSSSAVYGDGERVGRQPFTEASPLLPETAYGRFKAACEELLDARFTGPAPAFTILRPFNLIGPRQPPTFFASNLMRQLAAIRMGRQSPILELGDPTAFRDFIDVRDVAASIVSLLALPGQGEVYNVASGQAQDLRNVIQRAQDMSGLQVQLRIDPARPSDVVFQLGSSSKLERKTGWRPHLSMDQSLRDMMSYWLDSIEGTK